MERSGGKQRRVRFRRIPIPCDDVYVLTEKRGTPSVSEILGSNEEDLGEV